MVERLVGGPVRKTGNASARDSTEILQGVIDRIAKGELPTSALVCSAPTEFTDRTLKCIAALNRDDRGVFEENFGYMDAGFQEIVSGLRLPRSIYGRHKDKFRWALEEGSAHAGIPELITGRILTGFINSLGHVEAEYVQPTQVLDIDPHGYIAESSIKKARYRLAEIPEDVIAVIPGFVGAGRDGVGVTTRRGGSDASAAWVARALQVPCYIYTSTLGVLSIDTKKFPNVKPKQHRELTFEELSEASIVGETYVVNAQALRPLEEMDGALIVEHYRHSDTSGTIIMRKRDVGKKELASIVTGKRAHLIRVDGRGSDTRIGFDAQIKRVLADHSIPYHHQFNETNAITITVDRDDADLEFERRLSSAVHTLKRVLRGDQVRLDFDKHTNRKVDYSVVSIVGLGLARRAHEANLKIAEVLASMDLNPNPHSFSGVNYAVPVPTKRFAEAVERLHDGLVLQEEEVA